MQTICDGLIVLVKIQHSWGHSPQLKIFGHRSIGSRPEASGGGHHQGRARVLHFHGSLSPTSMCCCRFSSRDPSDRDSNCLRIFGKDRLQRRVHHWAPVTGDVA
ncbi:unnamed protein product [Cuscuta epithymum]|uniref:Uncharacterized protein n=1 Tax=Cuscuta epithymum TaxID=186058 RepID=A0AAV0C9H2_9ASTE|nr:unnamed protein product [Cuscuta epithymum]